MQFAYWYTKHKQRLISLCSSMDKVEQVAAVGQVLVDSRQDLTRRFRALFTLRNLGGNTLPQNIYTFNNTNNKNN